MSIKMHCENQACRKLLQLKDDVAGKRFKCPHCGRVQTAPDPKAPEPDAEPAPTTSKKDSQPEGAAAPPISKHRKRRKKSQRGFGLPGMVILGMPLPVFLGVLLLAGGLIAGGIYIVVTRNAKAAAEAKQKADWGSKDYDTFWNYLKDREAERTKPIPNRGPDSGYFDYDDPYPPSWVNSLTGMGPKEVQWQGAFQSVDGNMLTFDLPTSYKTAGVLGEHQPGAEYKVAFWCAESSLADWKAVPKGQKVRFSGLIGASEKDLPPVHIFAEGYDKGVIVIDNEGRIHDPLNYIIQINISEVKLIPN